jgi:hypothetical protein
MSRRILAVSALVAALSSFSACAEPVTAPQPSAIAPSGLRPDLSTCSSGWIMSDGRCQ